MSKFGSLYVNGNSFFHKLNPSVKLLIFILWSITVFAFLDLRMGLLLLAVGLLMLSYAQIPFNIARNLFIAVIIFNLINAIFIVLIAHDYGVKLSGQETLLLNIAGFKIYFETCMYVLVISLKYLSLLPIALIFIFTTHPSEFASSLNSIGLPYKLAYTFNIIFRYFPDIQNEFKTIAYAQAARGISFGKDEKSFLKRVKNLFGIMIPLINSALFRIDSITNAMDLRSFGKKTKRTWYNQTKFTKKDIICVIVSLAVFALFISYKILFSITFNYKLF